MAARSMTVDNTITTEDVLRGIFEYEATEDSPVGVLNIAADLNVDTSEILALLENVDMDFLGGENGALWFMSDTGYLDADDMISSYNAKHAPKPPTPAQRLKARNAAKAVDVPAVTPVVSGDAINSLIREVQEESTMTNSNETPEIIIPAGWENEEHASKLTPEHDSRQYMAPVELIPAPPEGVSHNMWELAYTAPTRGARKFWFTKCQDQAQAWKDGEAARKAAETAAPVVVEAPRPIDPVTGAEMPF